MADKTDKAETSVEALRKRTIAGLVEKIVRVDHSEICRTELGWKQPKDKNGNSKPPSQKELKVACVHSLMNTAKNHGWHLAKDGGFFYVYNGAFWVQLEKEQVKDLLRSAATKQGVPRIISRESVFVVSLYDQVLLEGFFPDKVLRKQSMINLLNGTLVLHENGVELKDFDHRHFLTHQLNFEYQPEIKNKLFLKYLQDVLPNPATQKTLQEALGYLFVKGLKLEKMIFLYGTGANGKSVIFEILTGLLGYENVSSYTLESLTDRSGYFRAKLKDIIVNYGSDINLNAVNSGLMKTLASGEPVEARLPYGDAFTITDYCKFIFNMNRIDDARVEHTHGFWRRFLIIPFGVTISEDKQDKDLHKQILQNPSGVLNWIIEGAERVIRNHAIYESPECKRFKDRFIRESDNVAMFVTDRKFSPHTDGRSYLSDLYADYREFCSKDGYKGVLGKIKFSARLEALGFEKRRENEMGIYFRMVRPDQYY